MIEKKLFKQWAVGAVLLGVIACSPLTDIGTTVGEEDSAVSRADSTSFSEAEELAYSWLCSQQDELDGESLEGLVDSFEDYWSEDSPKEICYTYDQAVATIAFLSYGDNDRAEEVLSMMENLQDSEGFWMNSYWWNGYGEEIRKHVGPALWMSLAVMNYEIQTGDTSYHTMGTDAIDWCLTYQLESGGITGGETQWEVADTWTTEEWISTEHNIDAYAALTYFASTSTDKQETYETAAQEVQDFLDSVLWDSENNRFYGGYKTDGDYVDTNVPMDVNPWSVLAFGADSTYVSSIDYVETADGNPGTLDDPQYVHSLSYSDDTITGYDFDWQSDDETASDDIGGGTLGADIWFEGSAFMSLAYYLNGDETTADEIITNIIKKQGADDSLSGGIPYCLMGTNNNYWLMAQENCVSSTGWLIMAINRLNPFTGETISQSTDTDVEEDRSYDPGSEWSLYWGDSFEDSTLDTDNWNYDVGGDGWGNGEYQYYTDRTDNVRVEGGELIIELLEETYGTGDEEQEFTSGRIHTQDKMEFTYGKVVACIKMPAGGNYIWPAFWMLGNDIDDISWPDCGEIDISEMFGGDLLDFSSNNTSYSTIHMNTDDTEYDTFPGYGYFGIESESSVENGDDLGDDYHYYAIEWDSSQIIFSLDGEEYQTVYLGEDFMSTFQKDYFVILNVALGSSWWEDDLDADKIKEDGVLDEEQAMRVDWVRVYTKDGLDEMESELANQLWSEELDGETARLYYNPGVGECDQVSLNYSLNGVDQESQTMVMEDDSDNWYYDLSGLGVDDAIIYGTTFTRTEFSSLEYTMVDQDLVEYTFTASLLDDSEVEEGDDDDTDDTVTEELSWGIEEVDGEIYLYFDTSFTSEWADAHYTVNSGGQSNVRMTTNESSSRFEYALSITDGDSVSAFFTYESDGAAYDSSWETLTYGTSDNSEDVTEEDSTEEDDTEDVSDETTGDLLVLDDFSSSSQWSSGINDLGESILTDGGIFNLEGNENLYFFFNGGDQSESFTNEINQDLSGYSTLVLTIKGSSGGEESSIDIILNDGIDYSVNLADVGSVSTSYDDIEISLSLFSADLSFIESLEISGTGSAKTIRIDSIYFQ